MYFQEEDQHNAVNKNQDGFFGDTYDQQDFFYSHEPFDIPFALPKCTPQDNIYSHKSPENYDAFHTQESDHINSYASEHNNAPTYDSYDAYDQY